jgi:hypothetical protein
MSAHERAFYEAAAGITGVAKMLAMAIAATIQAFIQMLDRAKIPLTPEGRRLLNQSMRDADKMAERLSLAEQIQKAMVPNLKVWEGIAAKLNIPRDENGNLKMPGGGFGDDVRKNLGVALQQFRFENAPKSQSMGIAAANMQAQSAAFNMSPFERENLKTLQMIADTMDRVLQKISPPTTS